LIDGQAPTAYTHESHKGTSWDMLTWDPQVFKDTIRTLHDTGMQISVHCGGDAALDLTLDAYEAALNANPRSDHRHRIEHAVISTKDATQRIKDLGVVIQSNPTFIRMSGDYYEQVFTKKQMDRVIVDREWLDAGIPLAYGSDAPLPPGISANHHRCRNGAHDTIWQGDQPGTGTDLSGSAAGVHHGRGVCRPRGKYQGFD
jgi:predicted amidohydrolase YtcJ